MATTTCSWRDYALNCQQYYYAQRLLQENEGAFLTPTNSVNQDDPVTAINNYGFSILVN